MGKCITAHTNLDQSYPGYINFTREDDGTVSVFLRGDPSIVEGCYVCGYPRDVGQLGRCIPGDDHCNNYCNLAPEKGPMQKAPKNFTHVKCGPDAKLTLSAAAFDAFIKSVK